MTIMMKMICNITMNQNGEFHYNLPLFVLTILIIFNTVAQVSLT